MSRCSDCEFALASHPDAAIRSALASEPDVSGETLTLLVTDMDAVVATTARWNLDHRPVPAYAENAGPTVNAHGAADTPWAGWERR